MAGHGKARVAARLRAGLPEAKLSLTPVGAAPSIDQTTGNGRTTIAERVGAFGRRHRLSTREEQIFLQLVQGSHPKVIGDALGCEYETVRTHLRRLQKKIGCARTRELLVRFISEL